MERKFSFLTTQVILVGEIRLLPRTLSEIHDKPWRMTLPEIDMAICPLRKMRFGSSASHGKMIICHHMDCSMRHWIHLQYIQHSRILGTDRSQIKISFAMTVPS